MKRTKYGRCAEMDAPRNNKLRCKWRSDGAAGGCCPLLPNSKRKPAKVKP